MREEFENLPEIADKLHTVVYSEGINQYHAAMINSGLSVKYIQGAWYAFQDRQKKIDAIMDVLNNNHPHLDGNQQALVLMDDIAEVLK